MNYCYIRVSRSGQEYDRQVQIFTDRGFINGINCTYVEETFTGTDINRPELTKLIDKLCAGDTLIVESLSRLSRGGVIKTLDLITKLVQEKKINVTIIKEGFELRAGEKPNSTTSLLLGIFSVLGQFERDLISERTKEGLTAKRAKGMRLGRPFTKSSFNKFVKVIEYIIENNVGQAKACYLLDFPKLTFQGKIAMCYRHYNTKDYKTIYESLKRDGNWGLF